MIWMPNKKENIENLQKKLGKVLDLERAVQKSVAELIEMKWTYKDLISKMNLKKFRVKQALMKK